MAKIENTTVYPTVTPAASDLLIATDVSDNNKTVTFLVSDLLGQSTLQDLQSVLNTGNSAVSSMFITGNIVVTGSVVPDSISAGGSLGSVGQVLTSTGTGIEWSSVSNTQTLQQTLFNGNSATGLDMNIDQGVVNITSGGLNLDNASNLSVGGVSTLSGDVNLGTTLNFGATTTISDYSNSVGTAGQVLTVNAAGTGVQWSSAAGTTPSLQQVLTVGNTATSIAINMVGNGAFTTSATNVMTLASNNTFSGTNTFTSDIEVDGTIEDGTGAVGTAGQVLSSTGSGVQWIDAASATTPTLQTVLTAGDTATEDINLTGNIDLTGSMIFQPSSTINAGGGVGVNGQVLTSTGGGLTWSNVSVNPTLNDVLGNGNTSGLSMVLTGSSTITAPTIIPTNIQDTLGSNGIAGYVLTSTATGIEWQSVSGASVNSVTAIAAGTSAGTAITITPNTGLVTVASNAYAGGSNVGHVPAGGAAGQYLDGAAGAWITLPSGGGTMSSFIISDSVTTQTINDGNTISFLVGTPVFSAGTGMTATVSATDTVTFVNTGITNLTGSADIGVSIAADGQATLSYTGSVGMTSWTLGDNSSTASITNGVQVDIVGGTGISSTLSGTDINLANTGVIDLAIAAGTTSTGNALSVVNVAGGTSTITPHVYAGASNVGYVPLGGTAGTVLDGTGAWVANAAGMASFIATADGGSPQTIDTTNNTLSILGFTDISTAASATGIVRVTHDDSGVVAGSYSYPSSVTVNARGHLTAVTAGSAPGTMSSFDITDGSTTETISNSDTLTFTAGAGITAVVSATDTVTITNTGIVSLTDGSGISIGAGSNPTITNTGVLSLVTTDGTFIDLTPDISSTGDINITADLSATGTTDTTTFLRGDNTWAVPTLAGNQVNTLTAGANLAITTGTGGPAFTGDVTIAYSGPTGSMDSFTVATDGSGSALTISDSDTLTINQGTGIGVALSATDTVTLSNTGVTNLSTTGSGLGITANTGAVVLSNTGVTSLVAGTGISLSGATGAVTITNTGSVGMTNWNLTADSGGTSAVDDAEYVSIVGSGLISTALTGTGTLGDPHTVTLSLASLPIAGTQNFVSKFNNVGGTSIGDSRVYDIGSGAVAISSTVTPGGYALNFGVENAIYIEDNTRNTFAVSNASGNAPSNGFWVGNVIVSPGGLAGNAQTSAFTNNTIIGADAYRAPVGHADTSELVVIGHQAAYESVISPGDIVIGRRAFYQSTSALSPGFPGNVVIGRNAASGTGGLKEGVVVIGSEAAGSGVSQGATIIGAGASAAVGSTNNINSVIIGSLAISSSYTGDLSLGVFIGHEVQNVASSNNVNNSVVIGTQASTTGNRSVVLGSRASNTFGNNQFVVGSGTAGYEAGSVTTEANSSSKVWNVVINGVQQKILLA